MPDQKGTPDKFSPEMRQLIERLRYFPKLEAVELFNMIRQMGDEYRNYIIRLFADPGFKPKPDDIKRCVEDFNNAKQQFIGHLRSRRVSEAILLQSEKAGQINFAELMDCIEEAEQTFLTYLKSGNPAEAVRICDSFNMAEIGKITGFEKAYKDGIKAAMDADREGDAFRIINEFIKAIDPAVGIMIVFLESLRKGNIKTCNKIACKCGGDNFENFNNNECIEALKEGYARCIKENRMDDAREIERSFMGSKVDFKMLERAAKGEPELIMPDPSLPKPVADFGDEEITGVTDITPQLERERQIAVAKEWFINNLIEANLGAVNHFLDEYSDVDFTRNERFKEAVIRGYLKARIRNDIQVADRIIEKFGQDLALSPEVKKVYLEYLGEGQIEVIEMFPPDWVLGLQISSDELKKAIEQGYETAITQNSESAIARIEDLFDEYKLVDFRSIDERFGRISGKRTPFGTWPMGLVGSIELDTVSDPPRVQTKPLDFQDLQDVIRSAEPLIDETAFQSSQVTEDQQAECERRDIETIKLFLDRIRAGDVRTAKKIRDDNTHISFTAERIIGLKSALKEGYYNALLNQVTDADDIENAFGEGIDFTDTARKAFLELIRKCDHFIEYVVARIHIYELDAGELAEAIKTGKSRVPDKIWQEYKEVLKKVIPAGKVDFDKLEDAQHTSPDTPIAPHDTMVDGLLHGQVAGSIPFGAAARADILHDEPKVMVRDEEAHKAERQNKIMQQFTDDVRAGNIDHAIVIYDLECFNLRFHDIPVCRAAMEESLLISLRQCNPQLAKDVLRMIGTAFDCESMPGFNEALREGICQGGRDEAIEMKKLFPRKAENMRNWGPPPDLTAPPSPVAVNEDEVEQPSVIPDNVAQSAKPECAPASAQRVKECILDQINKKNYPKASAIYRGYGEGIGLEQMEDYVSAVRKCFLDFLLTDDLRPAYGVTQTFGKNIDFSAEIKEGYKKCVAENRTSAIDKFETYFFDIVNTITPDLPDETEPEETAPQPAVISSISEANDNEAKQEADDEMNIIQWLNDNNKKSIIRFFECFPDEARQVFSGFLQNGWLDLSDRLNAVLKGRNGWVSEADCRIWAEQGVLKSLEKGDLDTALSLHKKFIKRELWNDPERIQYVKTGFYTCLILGNMKNALKFWKTFSQSANLTATLKDVYSYCIDHFLTDTAREIYSEFRSKADFSKF